MNTLEYSDYYKILPAIHKWSVDPLRIEDGIKVPADFEYTSDNNKEWMSIETLKKWIKDNKDKIGKI